MFEQTSSAQWIGSVLGEYRLTRLLSTSPMGPLFVADSVNSSATFLVRLLAVPPAQKPEALRTYQAYLERQAGHIITLRHPYMLPLVSYGMYQGLPYLVWPYTSMRSLATRISQSGVLDVVTTGRYLDQIAATLEYAHQQATFHRNLSLDCIYLQMDGQIAVADFGVRRLFELLTPGTQPGFFYGSLEALAPEQLGGGQVGAYTDVYALGAVTYRLLTGHPVFSGESYREVAEQHLQASPPSLAQARAGLPGGLDRVLADALAKDPAQRIQHPGAFADAYHRVVAPANTMRVPFEALGATSSPGPQPVPAMTGPSPLQRTGGPLSSPTIPIETGGSLQGLRQFFIRGWWFFVLVLVLVPLVSVGIFYLANNRQSAAASAPSGTLLFVDSQTPPDGSNNGLRIIARELAAPAAGAHYQVWLVNQKTEQITALGALTATAGQDRAYQLDYASPASNGKPGANVLAGGDMIEITEEQSNVAAPAGNIVLQVKFPPDAFVHIKHLLLAYPTTPGNIGLLVGVLRQTQLLNAQASSIKQAAGSGRTALVSCLAQSIVDISEGKEGAHYHPLDFACQALGVTAAGDGFGLLNAGDASSGAYAGGTETTGYIKNAANHASLATATPDATEALRQHASQVQTALGGVLKSVTAVDTAALTLLKTPSDSAAVAALVAATSQAYQGAGNPGEGGAIAAYQQCQQMATLSLTSATS